MKNFYQKLVWINLIILTFFISDCFLKKIFLKENLSFSIFNFLKFGLYKNRNIFFFFRCKNVLIIFLISLFLIYLIFKLIILYKKKNINLITSFTAIILGASGNLFERFVHGYVTDYICLFSFAFFNLSDVLIFFGIILLLYIKVKKS